MERGDWSSGATRPADENDYLRGEVARLRAELERATERRKADEEKLSLLSSLLGALPAHVIRADAEHRMTFINRVNEGFSQQGVLGQSVFAFMEPEYVEAARTCIERVLATGESGSYETVGRDTLSVTAHYRTVVSPITDGGQVTGYCLIAMNISEHVQREVALRDSEEKLRVAVEATRLALFSWDVATDEVEWNDFMFELTGEPQPLAPAAYVHCLVHPDDRELVFVQVEDAARGAGPAPVPHRILRKDGQLRWILPIGASRREGPDGVRVIGGLADVTRQHQFEELVRKSQRMDAVGNLTAGVAHNFNNMLAAILPVLELCRASVPHSLQPFVEQAEEAGRRAAELVRQLMTFAGQRGLAIATLQEPRDVVARALEICRGTLGNRLALVEQIEPALPPIQCEPGMMEQVLINLVLNARDALAERQSPDPRIDVSVTLADVPQPPRESYAKPGRYVRFRVQDNGPGVAEGVQRSLFEPFVTTKPPGRGTGLGLAVSHAMVRERGGWVALDASSASGSSFSAYLPDTTSAADSGGPDSRF